MARKQFGQHFLEPAWVNKVVRAIEPEPSDTFLEIGPGRGALTRPLAARVSRVVGFEIDRDLAAALAAGAPPNLTIETGDFLDVTTERLRALSTDDSRYQGRASSAPTPHDSLGTRDSPLRVAGNLPYNVASPILFKLVEHFSAGLPIADATVMLQREVADRLTARPGTREYGVLTVLIGYRATAARLLALPPGAFRPPPKVHSALVHLRFHAPATAARDERLFARIVQAVFTRRRKTLANALQACRPFLETPPPEALARAGLDGSRRPETLSIQEFVILADAATPPGRSA